MAEIRQLYDELNAPGIDRFKRALRNRGIAFTVRDLDFIKEDTARQVQAPPPKLTGKVAARHFLSEIQIDLIDFTASEAKGGERYILVLQDVFSRLLWTRVAFTKKPAEILRIFEDILQEIAEKYQKFDKNLIITSDNGGEWAGIKAKYSGYRIKSALRSLATLDVAIGYFKKALARDMRRAGTDDWASRIEKVTKGQNSVPNGAYLDDASPADVPANDELRAKLRDKNDEFFEQNRKEIGERQMKLDTLGKFRVLKNRSNFTRGWQPRYSEEVHNVDRTDFDKVVTTDGKTFLTKHTLPITGATMAPARQIERKGNLARDKERASLLEPFKNQTKLRFGPGAEVTLARIAQYLNSLVGFKQALKDARLNMKAPVASFLRLYPTTFRINGQDVQIR